MTAQDESGIMKKENFVRRDPRENDVVLQVTYCGMCHSDVHQLRGEWGNSMYPMIPGHEIIGVVIDTGDKVSKFKVGDSAAVGCMVDSCLSCNHCKNCDEQYCSQGHIATYNSRCVLKSTSSHKCHMVSCAAAQLSTITPAPALLNTTVAQIRARPAPHPLHAPGSHTTPHCQEPCPAQHTSLASAPCRGYDGEITMGGYSTHLVCREEFVLSLPDSIHCAGAAPLLCAGITTYSPMKHYGADKAGQHIGVVGCGGLGHMAIKIAKAFGQRVTVISRSYRKREMALGELKADAYIATSDSDALDAHSESFDAIIDTVSAEHDINGLLAMLKVDGKLICVGVSPQPYQLAAANLVMKRRMIGGSLIGGIQETQEVLDFCAEHGVLATVEEIPASRVNEAIDRIVSGDVHFRFSIDMLGSLIHKQ